MDSIEALCPSRHACYVALMTECINSISGADISDSMAMVRPLSQRVVIDLNCPLPLSCLTAQLS